MSGARVRRGDLLDVYADGDACAVMVASTVVVLSPLATAVLELLPAGAPWAPVSEVVAGLVERFGAPGDASPHDATLGVLRDLAAQGVVDLDGVTAEPTPA